MVGLRERGQPQVPNADGPLGGEIGGSKETDRVS
jgi:hypothetical protein